MDTIMYDDANKEGGGGGGSNTSNPKLAKKMTKDAMRVLDSVIEALEQEQEQ